MRKPYPVQSHVVAFLADAVPRYDRDHLVVLTENQAQAAAISQGLYAKEGHLAYRVTYCWGNPVPLKATVLVDVRPPKSGWVPDHGVVKTVRRPLRGKTC